MPRKKSMTICQGTESFNLALPLPPMKNGWRKKRSRPVAIWLLVGVGMIVVQIVLGGITRLTDSGLSITEWKPLLGTVPPTTDAQWSEAFNGYKNIAQYKHLHAYFTLDDFKAIFFWEWLHRFWGRLIGVVFAIPFIVFLIQKRFDRAMIKPMVILFLLGGLQGLIGWLMVQSGLNDEDLYVSHIRLAVHFMAALGLLVYTFWFAMQLLVDNSQYVSNASAKKMVGWMIGLLVVQLIFGAFMAGLKAALVAPTWPDINGTYLPALTTYRGVHLPFLASLVNNPLAVHFVHRNLAYLLSVLVFIWSAKAIKQKGGALFNTIKWLPLLLVVVQVGLGITAVLTGIKKVPQRWGVFEWSAQAHQFTAMLLLLSLVAVLFLHRGKTGAAAGSSYQSL